MARRGAHLGGVLHRPDGGRRTWAWEPLALAATALAAGREIIVSRGELIEIGDGFRLPDLLQSTGARIREVGTTNRTTLGDYQQAIGADTAFILKVHPSNVRRSASQAGSIPVRLRHAHAPARGAATRPSP